MQPSLDGKVGRNSRPLALPFAR